MKHKDLHEALKLAKQVLRFGLAFYAQCFQPITGHKHLLYQLLL